MAIAVLPLASGVHEKDRWMRRLEEYNELLENRYNDVELFNPVLNIEMIPDLKKFNIVFLIHLTGGTSRLAKEIYKLYPDKIYTLVAYGFHNSLPSAVSANTFIKNNGGRSKILYSVLPNLSGLDREVLIAVKALSILKSKIMIISDEHIELPQNIREKLPLKTITISWSELLSNVDKIKDSEVNDKIEVLKNIYKISFPPKNIYEIIKLYLLIKENISDDAILAVNCFPFILKYGYTPCLPVAMLNADGVPTACEADFYSLILMSMIRVLGGSSWIANLTSLDGDGIVFTHCTADLDILVNRKLMPHFETGRDIAVSGDIVWSNVAVARFSYDFEVIEVFKGKIIENMPVHLNRCRTQVTVKLNADPTKFIEKASRNHHVLFDLRHLNSLSKLVYYLGFSIRTW